MRRQITRGPQVQPGIAIPRDFVPVAVTRCVFPIDGARVEQRAEGELTALVAALKEPNRHSTHAVCTMIARQAVVITLVNDAGLRVTPTAPTGECGDAFPSVLMAVEQLAWTEVSRTQIDASPPAGFRCPGVLQPVVARAAADPNRPAATTPPQFPGGGHMLVCHYALAGSGDLKEAHPGDITELGGPTLPRFRAAVLAAPPVTGACDRPQPNTVLIIPDGGGAGPALTVEVGGCLRMLDLGGNLWQLDVATTALFVVARPFTTVPPA